MVGLNAGNLDAYRNAISGISKEQAALLLSTQGLNQAQIDLVLSNEKVTASEIAEAATLDGVVKKKSILTVEQQKQLISSQALTTEKLAEISATLGLETAENGSLISKKALNAEMVKQQLESIGVVGSTQAQIMNMLGLTTAETSAATASNVLSGAMAKLSLAMSTNPIGALITVIGIAVVSVYGLTKAFDALTDSAEEIDERVDDLISKYNDLKTTADNNASTVESLADEYESLSKGVNDLGENVSLTSEEYDRYNEIVNQIADIFPTLITGYTDEGTAILSLKGNVEQLRNAYKEAQQEAYNLLVATGKDSDGNDIMESYKNLSELDWWDSSIGAEDVTTTVKRDITKQILDLMSNMDTAVEEYDKLAQMIFDTYGDKGYNFLEEMGFPAIKDVFSDTSDITEEALIAGRATVQSYYQGFQSEIDTKLSKVKLMANAFLNTNDFYLDDSTNSELKNALSVMVNSIDEELANSFNGEQVKVGAYVNNIVNSIKGNEEVQKELIDLFTIDTSDMPVSDIVEQINEYINSIAIAINEDPEELKIRLGFDYVDDLEAQYQRAIDFAKDKFDGYDPTAFFKEHSINTQEEIDAWQEIAQGARDAAEAEKEYIQGSTLNENPLSISDVFSFKDSEDNATALSELNDQLSEVENAYQTCLAAKEEFDEQGYLSVDTLQKVLALGDDYLQYLFDEEGNVRLDAEAFQELTLARINDMEAQALSDLANNIQQITDEATATEYLTQKQNELANSYMDVAAKSLIAMSQIDGFADSKPLQNAYSSFASQYEKIKSLFASTRAGIPKLYSGKPRSSSAGSSPKKETDWKSILDSETDLLEKQLEAGLITFQDYMDKRRDGIEKYYRDNKISAKDYYDALEKMYDYQKTVYDRALSAVSRRYDKEIDRINTLMDAVKAQNDLLEKQKDDYGSVLSVVDRVYQNEIDRINKQKDAIQDKIDALNDEADAYDLIRRKEEAQYRLQRSLNQRTDKLYAGPGTGYIYGADREAVLEAQETLKDMEREEQVNRLQKEQEDLDTSITLLEEYRDKWAQIPDEHKRIANEQLAAQIWGADYERLILSSRISDLESFKDNYLAIQTRLDDNTALIASYEEKISYYEQLKEQWAQISGAYQESVEDQYAAMLLGQGWEADILNGRLETMNSFREEYIRIQQAVADAAWASSNEQVKAAQEAQKGAGGNTGAAGKITAPADNSPMKNALSAQIADAEAKLSMAKTELNNATDVTSRANKQKLVFYYENLLRDLKLRLPKYHTGLEKGFVGKAAGNKSLEILQRFGINPEEIPAVLRRGELVLTPLQTENIADRLKLLEAIDLTPCISLPDYSPLNNIAVGNNLQPPSVNIGEIHLHEVQNVDGLTDAIIREFPNKMLQAASRR